MKKYEITFITKEDLKDEPIKGIIEALGGKIFATSSLGQKTFTYPIKKEKTGFYTKINFELETEKIADFNKKLNLNETVLRYLLLTLKKWPEEKEKALPQVKKSEELEPSEPVEIVAEPTEEIVPEPEKELVIEEKAVEKEEEKKPSKKAAKAKPVERKKVTKPVKKLTEPVSEPVNEEERLEALDKKLEELLKE